jgi:glycosyltransferase involved in cell wall biosynthesis
LADAAQTIFCHKIDILVDLMGHSHHNRMELLALRPAPLQVEYLGFLSTTGAPFIDYLISDAVVVPKEHSIHYDEKLIRLPHCYQFNHIDKIAPSVDTADRAKWGLPPSGFVFCSFNNVYKVDKQLFDVWMRILQRSPGAVLWLNGGHAMASRQMRKRAQSLGVDPCRLVFAEKKPLREHLQRISLADLALDTLRYNGGATTANALASGVPVLTVMGRHWASRMTASHLMAIGLPELIRPSLSAYEQAAVDLAQNRQRFQELRGRLESNINRYPLFDSKRFVDHLEAGYESIWQRYSKGLEPIHMDIPAFNDEMHADSKACPQEEDPIASANGAPISKNHTSIYYFCPDFQCKSAGIRRLYRHVAILNNAGFPAFLLNEKPGFKNPGLPHVPSKNLSDATSDTDAVFVIPEGMPRIMHLLKDHPGRCFAIALSWVYVYSTLPDGVDWRNFNIERVLAFSPVIADMIHWSMGLPVHLLASSIDHHLYHYDSTAKQMQISYIHRKAEHVTKLQAMLASRNPDYLNKFKWVELDGLSQEAYAAQIRRSAIFLVTSLAEGFPTSCLEAMAAGALVAGYDAVGGKEILSPNGRGQTAILAPNGDYAALAYKLAPALNDFLAGQPNQWHPMIERGRQTAFHHTPEKETSSLLAFWKGVLQQADGDVPNR